MDEKDFLEILISERMGMHYDNFKKDCPPTAEQIAEAEKADQAHDLLFEQLTPEQRELVLKVYFKGMRIVDIARKEGVGESAVRDRIRRIHKKMKKYLE